MTLQEARRSKCCRICAQPIKLDCPARVFDQYETLDWPEKLVLNFGKEFAHELCYKSYLMSQAENVVREEPRQHWKYFSMMQIRESREHAKSGGFAVHHTGMPFRKWNFTAHLFASDNAALILAIRKVGADPKWIQFPRTAKEHFDLMGRPLENAMALCGRAGFDPTKKAEVDLFA